MQLSSCPKPQTSSWANTRKTQPTPWNCDATLLLTYVISSCNSGEATAIFSNRFWELQKDGS